MTLKVFVSLVFLMMSVPVAVNSAETPKPPGDYPNRPITLVVCFGTGGGQDQMARAMAGALEKVIGMPIQVINRPGAGGLACKPDFFNAPADGYTIIAQGDNLVTMYASTKIDWHPLEKMKPLLITNIAPAQLFINATDKRFLTNGEPDFEKVLAYAKEKPGNLSIASYGGMDTLEGVYIARLNKHFDIETRVVSYDRPAERYGAVLGGHVDILIQQSGDVKGLIEAEEILPILSITEKRMEMFPNTPAVGEDYGLEWDIPIRWRTLLIRKETPPEITDYLVWAMKKAWESPGHQAHLSDRWLDIVHSYRSPAETVDIINREIELFSETYHSLGMPSRIE